MFKEFKLDDIKSDGFIHSRVYEFICEPEKKLFKINLGFADLIQGGAIVDCTVTITDWWHMEVFEYNKQQKVKQFDLDEIPEIDRIIKLSFNNDELILTDFGMHNNTAIDYKFTKPKIHITGEYDPN